MTAANKKVMDAIGATIKPRRSVQERAIQTAKVLADQTALTAKKNCIVQGLRWKRRKNMLSTKL